MIGPPGRDWIVVHEVRTGVHMILEGRVVSCWLVCGRERAVLFDTGLALTPLRPIVERLTGLPVAVVNSHSHVDHVGANHEFPERAIHRLGAADLTKPHEPWLAEMTVGMAERRADAMRTVWRDAHELVATLPVASIPPPLPERRGDLYGASRLVAATRLLDEGAVIDLGGRRLEVLHTPGHTADSICLWEPSTGLLFAGDTLDERLLWTEMASSSVEQYGRSMRRILALQPHLSAVLMGHAAAPCADFSLIEAAVSLLQDARRPCAPWQTVTGFGGRTARALSDGRLTLLDLGSGQQPVRERLASSGARGEP